METTSSSKTRF
jgi:hypothetical protein